ncbi:MAG: hypothetical protein ACQEUT_10955 [Bacillota bacterium]
MYLAGGAWYIKTEKSQDDVPRWRSEVHQIRTIPGSCTSLVERGTSKLRNLKMMYLAGGARYIKSEKSLDYVPRWRSEVHQIRKIPGSCTSLAERSTSNQKNHKIMYLAGGARYIKSEKSLDYVPRWRSAVHQNRKIPRLCTSPAQRGTSKQKNFKMMYLAGRARYIKPEKAQGHVPRQPSAIIHHTCGTRYTKSEKDDIH